MCSWVLKLLYMVLQDSLTFHYIPSLGKAVCQCHDTDNGLNTVVGFEFDGVTVIEDFISLDSEFNLAKCIDLMPWKDSQSGRRKQDFGPKVNFKKQKLKTSAFTGLPDYIQPVVTMFNKVKELADFNVVELCNLEYEPDRGSSIDPHFDDTWLWGERLVTLNLLSDTHLSMINNAKYVIDVIRNVDISKTPAYFNETLKQLRTYTSSKFKNLHADQAVVKIPLQRRSLVILQGPARHEWQHSIQRLVSVKSQCE